MGLCSYPVFNKDSLVIFPFLELILFRFHGPFFLKENILLCFFLWNTMITIPSRLFFPLKWNYSQLLVLRLWHQWLKICKFANHICKLLLFCTDALGSTLASYLDKPRVYVGCMKSGEVFSEPWVWCKSAHAFNVGSGHLTMKLNLILSTWIFSGAINGTNQIGGNLVIKKRELCSMYICHIANNNVTNSCC